jgi:SulP family sulfate permease
LKQLRFDIYPGPAGKPELYLTDLLTKGGKPHRESWRIRKIGDGELLLASGGEVVGKVPSGLPSLELLKLDKSTVVSLLSTALVICLVGFMEAISIAKAMAAKTKQRVDPNQELVGQGLANLVSSLSHAFPVSGSFSRSAVNLNAGAVTGMSSVFTGLIMVITLLFLTPLLYYLPQSVLAAVIMMAVAGLINFKAIKHAWQAHRHDGIAALTTFAATLGFAPHLDNGILMGAGLAILLFLYRTMKPSAAILSRHQDGNLRDALSHNLQTSEHIIPMRYQGALYFANVSYFEDVILGAVAAYPRAKYILVVGDAINQLDASGEEVIRHLFERLRATGVTMVYSGLNRHVLKVMENTGLYALIGAQYFFRDENAALDAIYEWITDETFDARVCPLTPKSAQG